MFFIYLIFKRMNFTKSSQLEKSAPTTLEDLPVPKGFVGAKILFGIIVIKVFADVILIAMQVIKQLK